MQHRAQPLHPHPGHRSLVDAGSRAPHRLPGRLLIHRGRRRIPRGAGCCGINLGAITAAIALGPESHPDRTKRYIAGLSGGLTYLLVGSFGGVLVAGFQAIPSETVAVVAAVALLGSALTALTGAMSGDTRTSLAAITTLAITMSGVVILSVGAASWGLLAGSAVYLALTQRREYAQQPSAGKEAVTTS